MTQEKLEKFKFTMEIIRTICPIIMVILQIAIITGLVVMNHGQKKPDGLNENDSHLAAPIL